MGTTYNIILNGSFGSNDINLLQIEIDSLLKVINDYFSTYLDASEISQFNRSKETFKPSNEFIKLFNLSKEIYNLTDGSFDPTVYPLVELWGFGNKDYVSLPPQHEIIFKTLKKVGLNKLILKKEFLVKLHPDVKLDFSAVAKGFGVDRVSQLLQSNGYTDFMVEIGGEVYCSGKLNENLWKIGIQNPDLTEEIGQILIIAEVSDKAIATSGNYRNYFTYNDKIYSHTINPKTGYPVENNVLSITVLSNDCATADALATGLMVLGDKRGMELVNQLENTEAIFIKKVGDTKKLLLSENADKYVKIQ